MDKAQRYRANKKAAVDAYKKKIAPVYGPEAAELVMAEYERRQMALMKGGGFSLGSLFGKGED